MRSWEKERERDKEEEEGRKAKLRRYRIANVIGAIEAKASNRRRFILVAIDYFTKWVEAASYASVT